MELSKKELRKQYRHIRNAISEAKRSEESRILCEKLLETEEYKNAGAVFCYLSYGSEFETSYLIAVALSENKVVAVPKIVGDDMIFCRIFSDTEYLPNQFGIMEPVSSEEILPQAFASVLLILPGLCFDNRNGRVGYGGGYYDRYVAKHKADSKLSVAAPALSCQFYNGSIPMDKHDVRPDLVIFP